LFDRGFRQRQCLHIKTAFSAKAAPNGKGDGVGARGVKADLKMRGSFVPAPDGNVPGSMSVSELRREALFVLCSWIKNLLLIC
jgi:hypothetical protein